MKKEKFKIPKISKKEFWQRLKKRKYEDVTVIKLVEDFFRKKRGYVFKMPKPGGKVILLTSGGLDSIISWGMLMEEFGLKIYPFYIKGNNSRYNKEKKSLHFFSKFYANKYPKLFVKPEELNSTFPPKEIAEILRKNDLSSFLHPKIILNYLDPNLRTLDINKLDLICAGFISFYSLFFAKILELKKNIKIKTIFSGVMAGDGTVVKSQTFTVLRATMMLFCIFNNDFSWQFSTTALEKELGLFLTKADYIKWAVSQGIPIERTWSCHDSKKHHCGNCFGCYVRKLEFKRANVIDKTIYKSSNMFNFFDWLREIVKRRSPNIYKKLKRIKKRWS